jgi:hypothetical protein
MTDFKHLRELEEKATPGEWLYGAHYLPSVALLLGLSGLPALLR